MNRWNLLAILLMVGMQVMNLKTLSAREISILTWNIQGIPKPFVWNNQMKRAKLIGKELKDSDFDIIVFQEAFSGLMRKKIFHELEKNYPFNSGIHRQKKWPFLLPSGVWMVSKWPIKLVDQVYFHLCTKSDCFASKGATLVELIFSDREKVQIMGTHLQAWPGEKTSLVRKSQLEQIQEMLTNHQNSHVPQILAGDFNIDTYHQSEYEWMIQTLSSWDEPMRGEIKYTSGDPDNRYTKKGAPLELIDYIMLRNVENHNAKVLEKKVVRIKSKHKNKIHDLSDHDAILAKFDFSFSSLN